MRIWHVPFGELDPQRVLGQHNEIHALYGMIVPRDSSWGGLRKEDETYLHWVHERIVHEMFLRGWPSGGHAHQSPLPSTIPASERRRIGESALRVEASGQGQSMAERRQWDRWCLWLRWEGQYKGRLGMSTLTAEAQADYEVCEQLWQAQGAECIHDGTTETVRGGEMCLLCKRAVQWNGSSEWSARPVGVYSR